MMKSLIAGIPVIFLIGCASWHWEKPGLMQETFLKDRYECRKEARPPVSIIAGGDTGTAMIINHVQTENIFEACMEARGYIKKEGKEQPVSLP